jgi:hypothetical protein
VSEQDPHSPTTAGPEPTPTVGSTEASFGLPAGSALPAGGEPSSAASGAAAAVEEKPELLVGAAFAGGIVAAMVLKRIFRRD